MKRVILALTFAALAGAIVSSQIPPKFDSYQVKNPDGTYRVNHHSDGSLLLPEDTRVYFAPDGKTMRQKLDELEPGNGGGGNGDTIIARGWDVSIHFEDNPGSGYGPDGDPTANVAAVNDALKASFQASSHLDPPWGRCAAIVITDHLLINSTIQNTVDGYRVDCVIDGKCSGHVEMVESGSGAAFTMLRWSDADMHPNIPGDVPELAGTANSKTGLTLVNITVSNPIGYCVLIKDGRRANQAFLSRVDLKCTDINTPDSAALKIQNSYAGYFHRVRCFDCTKHGIYVTSCTNLHFENGDVVWCGRMLRGNAGDVTVATDDTIGITPPRPLNDGVLNGMEIEITDGTGGPTTIAATDVLGQVRTIVSNTGSNLLITPEWHTVPDATSSYWIRVKDDAAFVLGTSGSRVDQIHVEDNHGLGMDVIGFGNIVSGWFERNYRYDSTHKRGTRSVVTPYSGTVVNASGTQITFTANASGTDGFYVGNEVELDTGEVRLITAYDGTNKIATVNREWSTGGSGGQQSIKEYNRSIPAAMPRGRVHGSHNVFDARNYPAGDILFSQSSYYWPANAIAGTTTRMPVHDRGRNLDLYELAAKAPATTSNKAFWSLAIQAADGDPLSLNDYDLGVGPGTYVDQDVNGVIDIVHRAGAYNETRWIWPFNSSAGFVDHVIPPGAVCLCRVRYSTTRPDYFSGRVTNLDNAIFKLQLTPQGLSYPAYDDPYFLRWWGHAYSQGVHEVTAIGWNHTESDWSLTTNDFSLQTCWDTDWLSPELGITIHTLQLAICHATAIPP